MASALHEVSSTRLYLGNVPRNATKPDVEAHFGTHGTGKITEIKLMNGFGFIEYEDEADARDVVPAFHGSDFMGERLVVQFARGPRRPDNFAQQERAAPRPRRTPFRMQISGLSSNTSWQDLKDFARQSGLEVVYSEVSRDNDGKGFVEYDTSADLRAAVEKLDGREFKNQAVRCVADERPRDRNARSRSPAGGRRGHGPPPDADYYDRRPPPRGYSPRSDYRRRSPGPRGYYDERDRYPRSPPRARGPPIDGYGPPPRRYDDGYDRRPPPPRNGYDPDPYVNGYSSRPPYDEPPRGRPRSPPRGYEGGYDRRPPQW